ANTIVGQTFRTGGMTDVAAHLADSWADPSLRAHTGVHGLVRVDQIHVTAALVPSITDYQRVDPRGFSDHWGVVARLDLSKVNLSAVFDFT
ncbi:hypothetical protein ACFFOP_35695, partial [Sinosporangium siamense]|uniref:hypothetical protein n=1 Tax=Sinosporangium siamense TaxID=1367973 RepID=UPI0035EBE170